MTNAPRDVLLPPLSLGARCRQSMLRCARPWVLAAGVSGAALAPTPALAVGCPTWDATPVLVAYAASTAADIYDTLMKFFTDMQNLFSTFFSDEGKSLVVQVEKSTAAKQQLAQAGLNYDAVLKAVDRSAYALDSYAAPSSRPVLICETSTTAQATSSGGHESRQNAKALAAADVARTLYTDNSSLAMRALWSDHNTRYCSQIDADRGRGCTPVAAAMRDADVNAASVTIPNGGETYGPGEFDAARALAANVIDPIPVEMIPPGMEKTPQGQRYLIEQRAAAAQISAAQTTFNQVIARHASPSDLAGGSPPSGANISVTGMMKKFVDEHFGSFKYSETLQKADNVGLLREIAINLAAKNWFDYQLYLQGENIEAVDAVRLAIVARQDAERRLGQLRQASAINR